MDTNIKKSAMIALLPQSCEWCKIEPAHMTIVSLGEIENLKPSVFNDIAKDAASVGMLSNTIMAKVMGVEVFGDEEKVDVLRIESTPEIQAIRRMLEPWDTSEFPFRPHVTIGPEGTAKNWSWNQMGETTWNSQSTPMPMYLVFDKIMVRWGEDAMTFWLRKF